MTKLGVPDGQEGRQFDRTYVLKDRTGLGYSTWTVTMVTAAANSETRRRIAGAIPKQWNNDSIQEVEKMWEGPLSTPHKSAWHRGSPNKSETLQLADSCSVKAAVLPLAQRHTSTTAHCLH